MTYFNPKRLDLALRRRRMTARQLSEETGITNVSLSRIKQGKQGPESETVDVIARALNYPKDFFYGGDIENIQGTYVSFRSLAAVTQREQHAALAAGSIGFMIFDWVEKRYDLPEPDLIDFGQERDPCVAARVLRQHWSLGERPISNMVRLLESKGVRILSLNENTKNIDAYSCWRDGTPYVFLNNFKTTERSRFDAAHELGHLVLHKHGGAGQGKEAENEANSFASSFLVPQADLLSNTRNLRTLNEVIEKKRRWGVSAAALIYRAHKLGMITEWQNRTLNIQLRSTYKSSEPNPMTKETSVVWSQILKDLWSQGVTREKIAKDLGFPSDEIESLLYGLAETENVMTPVQNGARLRVV